MAQQRLLFLVIGNLFTFLGNAVRSRVKPVHGYVVLDIKGTYVERKPSARPLLLRLLARAREDESIEALTERLDRIAGDPSVRGVVLRITQLQIDLATADGIRAAISRFRSRGKEAVAYFTNDIDLRSYYMASGASRICAVESAHFLVTGLSLQVQFMKDALARWGIQADMEAMGEYKTAADSFTRTDMSEPHREMLDSLLDATFDSVLEGVAESRNLQPGRVRQLTDEAPFSVERARDEGLVDAVLYEDKLAEHLGTAEAPAELAPWRAASIRLRKQYRHFSSGTVSIVSVRGMIVHGESRDVPAPVPFIGGLQAGSETLIRALRHAERDPGTKAIVCYVDSPGGSALASDLIWREVQRINERKPVVAYMGSVAASGGYYVAVGARHIVAHPQTLTGSIGVIGGKVVLEDLYQKAGIRSVLLTRGRRAALFTGARPFASEERETVREMLSEVYTRFKDRVSAGRDLDMAAVEERARGRVWTGRQALQQGLVDELGDLQAAVDRAKAFAGLTEAKHVRLAEVAAPHNYSPPLLNSVQALGELAATAKRLNRDAAWAWMPWTITME